MLKLEPVSRIWLAKKNVSLALIGQKLLYEFLELVIRTKRKGFDSLWARARINAIVSRHARDLLDLRVALAIIQYTRSSPS